MKNALALMLGLMACATASASCYTILNPKGDVVYRASQPPVDMSYALHQVVPPRFGAGAKLEFGIDRASCVPVGEGVGGPSSYTVDEVVQQLVDQREPGALWGVGKGAQSVLDRQSH
ncbi:hypothetical protein [Comamonas serinivorans]|nr:hypothetical protein [Comamonas serinivorans]